MFDIDSPTVQLHGVPPPAQTSAPPGCATLRHTREDLAQPDWRLAALDEVDYGMLVVGQGGVLVHCNFAAHVALSEAHPLQLVGGELRARDAHDAPTLQMALRNAKERGLRKLLTLGKGVQRVGIALVPLAPGSGTDTDGVLVILGKRKVCEPLSIQAFASAHCLTAAETRVLVCLCSGEEPMRIADQLGVAVSTVRTQIGSVRQKTGTSTIRALLQQIGSLPPLMGTLRNVPPRARRGSGHEPTFTDHPA